MSGLRRVVLDTENHSVEFIRRYPHYRSKTFRYLTLRQERRVRHAMRTVALSGQARVTPEEWGQVAWYEE